MKLSSVKIDLSHIQAVIFDMDGTMVDNMQYHEKAWKEFLIEKGIVISEAEFRETISGRKNSEIFKIVFQRDLTSEETRKYVKEKEELYRELYAEEVHEIEGLTKAINNLQRRGIKLALATSAPKENRDFILSALSVADMFPVVVGDEDITHGKPNPEIYIKTAEKLNVPAANCLVFEDSPAGVQAAKSAGMEVVGLLTYHTAQELSYPKYTILNFSQIEFS